MTNRAQGGVITARTMRDTLRTEITAMIEEHSKMVIILTGRPIKTDRLIIKTDRLIIRIDRPTIRTGHPIIRIGLIIRTDHLTIRIGRIIRTDLLTTRITGIHVRKTMEGTAKVA